MTAIKNINAKADNAAKSSVTWAKGLKIKLAARNLLILTVGAAPWLLGRLWLWVKMLLGLVVFWFRAGAKMAEE